MNKTADCIFLIAGNGVRSNLKYNKALYEINNRPLYSYALNVVLNHPQIHNIYVVYNALDRNKIFDKLQNEPTIKLIEGGKTRSESVRHALYKVTSDKVIIVDGVRPFLQLDDIDTMILSLDTYDACTFYTPIANTIKEVQGDKVITLDRNHLYSISTPQGFNRITYKELLDPTENDELIFDEISLVEKSTKIGFIPETHFNIKATTAIDLSLIENLLAPKHQKIGHSYDFHPFTDTKELVLGGIHFKGYPGLRGHSDADVVFHAITEAIIGALGYQDLGTQFPDNDPKYYQVNSQIFLEYAKQILYDNNYMIGNIDLIIYLEEPKLSIYKKNMQENIAKILNISSSLINIKATTMEKCGLIGNKEGIASECVVLIHER